MGVTCQHWTKQTGAKVLIEVPITIGKGVIHCLAARKADRELPLSYCLNVTVCETTGRLMAVTRPATDARK